MPARVEPIGLDELEALSRYAAGECGAEEAARIEAQLASREELRRALARLRKLELATGELASSARAQAPRAASALDEQLIARAVSASAAPRRASRWVAGALALAASIALFLYLRGPRSIPAQLEISSGTVQVAGSARSPGSAGAIHPGEALALDKDAAATLRDAHGRVLFAAGAQANYGDAGTIALAAGTALIEGARTVEAQGVRVQFDGAGIISTEPFQAMAQLSLATSNTHEGETMMTALKARRSAAVQLAAGATLAIWMIQGTAQAAGNGETATVRAGESWSRGGSPAAALVADARVPGKPSNASAPAAAAQGNPDESYLNMDKSEALAAFAESGGTLAICLHKGAWTHEEGKDQVIQMNPPQALSFHAAIQVAAKNGHAQVTDAVITRESPTLEEHLHDCLVIALRRLKLPAPHPGALASLRIPLRLVGDGKGDFNAWLGASPDPLFLDAHKALLALNAEPENQAKGASVKSDVGEMSSLLGEAGDPTLGPAQAPVTIIEFTDFQCSFCKKVNDTILTLQKTYGDKIRFVFKQNPLPMHAQAELAAEAALSANGQGKFEEYRKLLYYGGGDSLSREQLVKYATQLGLDVARFNADLDNHTYAAQIAADKADAKSFNVMGVPTFYINGKPLQGAQPVDKFMEMIDAELAAH